MYICICMVDIRWHHIRCWKQARQIRNRTCIPINQAYGTRGGVEESHGGSTPGATFMLSKTAGLQGGNYLVIEKAAVKRNAVLVSRSFIAKYVRL